MLKEVIVVEGKSDIQRIHQAINADCIATEGFTLRKGCLLYTSPSPRDQRGSRMPSSA